MINMLIQCSLSYATTTFAPEMRPFKIMASQKG